MSNTGKLIPIECYKTSYDNKEVHCARARSLGLTAYGYTQKAATKRLHEMFSLYVQDVTKKEKLLNAELNNAWAKSRNSQTVKGLEFSFA